MTNYVFKSIVKTHATKNYSDLMLLFLIKRFFLRYKGYNSPRCEKHREVFHQSVLSSLSDLTVGNKFYCSRTLRIRSANCFPNSRFSFDTVVLSSNIAS